jgi:hypothetical protein
MNINFRTRRINRDIYKLNWKSTLIIIKKKSSMTRRTYDKNINTNAGLCRPVGTRRLVFNSLVHMHRLILKSVFFSFLVASKRLKFMFLPVKIVLWKYLFNPWCLRLLNLDFTSTLARDIMNINMQCHL